MVNEERTITRSMLEEVLLRATTLAAAAGIAGRTAIRRVVGTAEWRHDPDRVAAAEAKRARRRARPNGSST